MRAVDDVVSVGVPLHIRRRGLQLKLAAEPEGAAAGGPDRSLLTAILRARDWASRILAGASPSRIAEQEQVTDGYVSQLLPLAFLAPSIVEEIVAGTHPAHLTADRLIWKTPISPDWRVQETALCR